MRVVHRTAAVVLLVVAIVVIAELIHAVLGDGHVLVVRFILFAIGACAAIALALFLWRSPKRP
jgi:bacteriorhodopsin